MRDFRDINNHFLSSAFSFITLIFLLIALSAIPASVSADLIKPLVFSNSEIAFATYIYDSIL